MFFFVIGSCFESVHLNMRTKKIFRILNRTVFFAAITSTLLIGFISKAKTPNKNYLSQSGMPSIEAVNKIWSTAPHSAFTDLIRYKNKWYCIFREGEKHASDDGRIRLLSSVDGITWKSIAYFRDTAKDLRDPKLSVTPKGRLMLYYISVNKYNRDSLDMVVRFSKTGKNWTRARKTNLPNLCTWRITWHKGIAYSIAWNEKQGVFLYQSKNGVHFKLVTKLDLKEFPNEAKIVFKPDGKMYAIVRKDNQPKGVYMGVSEPPYTDWKYKTNYYFAGGPNMILLPDTTMLAAFRHYENGQGKTLLVRENNLILETLLELPSGGDTGYPGMVFHNDKLWISYYSSHEGQASIYLARIKFVKPNI